MNFRDFSSNFDMFLSMLSVFDLGGVLYDPTDSPSSQGLEDDMAQLLQDQKVLSEDYKKVWDRLSSE